MPRGEVVVGGTSITAGYFNNEEKTKEVYRVLIHHWHSEPTVRSDEVNCGLIWPITCFRLTRRACVGSILAISDSFILMAALKLLTGRKILLNFSMGSIYLSERCGA